MCDLTRKRFEPPQQTAKRRLKVWEVDRSYHCAILGTCLTLHELKKIIRQSGIILDPRASDYDAHRALVSVAGQDGHSARLLTRLLDKKYQRTIAQLMRLSDEKLLGDAWQKAIKTGDIAGPFWTLVTHPHMSEALLDQIYGEVHMLSHLEGASNRADLKRLVRLEASVASLKADAIKQAHQHQNQLRQKQQFIQQLEQQMLVQISRNIPQQTPAEIELNEQLLTLRRELAVALRQLDRTKRRLGSATQRAEDLTSELESSKQQLKETEAEQRAIELALGEMLCDASSVNPEPTGSLCGRQVVYVGGRTSLSPHFRALVEKFQGQFEHHDGGVEESRANLHCLLSKADMVFCPIDCISHDACLKVKRFCKRNAKTFIPLRSSGLSAFAKELSDITANKH
ncbi:MAG: DUF2325 domain-containing protein [Sedimenticola sp.]|jgi:hypothetical protein|nr:DUF2325 domain-containing protein [Sedimenticola sp.]